MRVGAAGEAPVLQLFKAAGDREPYQELPLQACYSVSEVGAQQFDTFGKIFTVKLQYVFYKERPGVRYVRGGARPPPPAPRRPSGAADRALSAGRGR